MAERRKFRLSTVDTENLTPEEMLQAYQAGQLELTELTTGQLDALGELLDRRTMIMAREQVRRQRIRRN